METQPQPEVSSDGIRHVSTSMSQDPAQPPLAAVCFSCEEFHSQREKYIHDLTDRALDQLAANLEAGRSQALVVYLNTMSRFHRYSFGNQMLIAIQRSDATHVAGFHTWKQFNRFVNKGEKGIVVLAPVTRIVGVSEEVQSDGSVKEKAHRQIVNTKPVYVFDVSQTHGDPLPEFPGYHGDPAGYFDRLRALYDQNGITLSYPDRIVGGALGVSRNGEVQVVAGLEPAESFHVHIHELAHELLHRNQEQRKHSTLTSRETEAEAVAYVVCCGVGLDCSTAASDYIQLYQGNRDALSESLHDIRRAANAILKYLIPDRSPNAHS